MEAKLFARFRDDQFRRQCIQLKKKSFLKTFRGGNVFNWKMFSENISIQRALPKHPLFDLSSRGYPPQLSLIYCLYLSPYLVRKEPRLVLRKVIAVHLVPLVLSRTTVIYYLLSYKWRYLPTKNTLPLLERPIRTQIYSRGTNKFWNSDKYILKSWQIHFYNLDKSLSAGIYCLGYRSNGRTLSQRKLRQLLLQLSPSTSISTNKRTQRKKCSANFISFCWKLYCLISFLTGGLYI